MSIRILSILFGIIILLMINFSQGVAMEGKHDYIAKIKEQFKNINFSDGVGKEDAIIIAQNYMINEGANFYKDFNILKPIVEEDSMSSEDWIVGFPTRKEFRLKTGLQWNAMYINKKTGKVKYSGEGPS